MTVSPLSPEEGNRHLARNATVLETSMPTRRAFLASAAAVPVVALLNRPAMAAEPPVFATDGIAIQGYDPVAYFTEGKPVEGSPDITSDWNGAKLRFASAENKSTFDGNPEKYAPKYGGYCAYAVSKGYVATTDPAAWSIHDDRLYLNYSKSVRALWAVRKRHHIEEADKNWPSVLG
jgi:YHS domain-containing protein